MRIDTFVNFSQREHKAVGDKGVRRNPTVLLFLLLLGDFTIMDQGRTKSYSGMTVNERLFASKLMDDFDNAARRQDRAQMISILVRVDLSEKDAAWSVDALLATPQKYGY